MATPQSNHIAVEIHFTDGIRAWDGALPKPYRYTETLAFSCMALLCSSAQIAGRTRQMMVSLDIPGNRRFYDSIAAAFVCMALYSA